MRKRIDANALRATERLGRSGLNRWGGRIDEEFHRNLRGPKAAKVYREMSENDPVLGAIIHMTTSLMRGVQWRVDPADPERPSALAAAAFVEENLRGLATPWDDVVDESLEIIRFGWAYLETVYKQVGGRLMWEAFEGRAQETLDEWVYDESTGKCVGWWQTAPPDLQRRFLPFAKGVHLRTRKLKDNPEGQSLLRPAYRPWYFAKRIQEVEGIGIERDMTGLPIVEVPGEVMAPNPTAEQAALRAMAEEIVRTIRMDERMGLVIPREVDEENKPTGWKFRLETSGGRRAIDTNAVVVRYEQRMAMVFLAQFILMGMDKVGSFALADNATNLFAVSLGSILDKIEDGVHEQATKTLCAMNGFREEDVPRICHGDIEKADLQKFAAFLKDLVGAGVITPDAILEGIVREKADLPPHDPSTAIGAGADMVQPGATGAGVEDDAQDDEEDGADDAGPQE